MGRYYTRSFRVNGRVVREYVGSGQAAEEAALEDQRGREKRRLQREVQRKESERLEAIARVLSILATLSKVSMKEALETAGYHCHKGQWRKQRLREVDVMSEKQQLCKQPPDLEAAHEIMEAARQGRPGSLEALGKLVEEWPQFVNTYGDQTDLAEWSLICLIAGEDSVGRLTRRSWLRQTRRRLAEPGDGELERLLIHRLSLNLLAVSYAEGRRAERWREGVGSWGEVDSWDRHVTRLQSDLFKATRALREARRLARPTVLAQMNIAERQQINITAAHQPIEAADSD